jgi:hypothetical protein
MNDPINHNSALREPLTATIPEKNHPKISEPWKPKNTLGRYQKIATFGSCFAQNLGPALKEQGYTWFDAEPAPDIFVPEIKKKYNYGVFSARTGNINTVAALRQWVSWAIGVETPPEEIWQKGDRFFDPFRPSIEPNGFATPEELLASRNAVLRAIRNIAERADWFVFTLGQTEGWVNSSRGYVYAMCPGKIAREFDSNDHFLKNYSFPEVSADLNWVIDAISTVNKKMRFVLTVSAIPLTAAESGNHVIVETPLPQSLLREAALTIAENREIVDYFPSYEIITAAPSRAMLYEPNEQAVPKPGAEFVKYCFFRSLAASSRDVPSVIELGSAINPSRSDAHEAKEFWSRILKTRNTLRDLM